MLLADENTFFNKFIVYCNWFESFSPISSLKFFSLSRFTSLFFLQAHQITYKMEVLHIGMAANELKLPNTAVIPPTTNPTKKLSANNIKILAS